MKKEKFFNRDINALILEKEELVDNSNILDISYDYNKKMIDKVYDYLELNDIRVSSFEESIEELIKKSFQCTENGKLNTAITISGW